MSIQIFIVGCTTALAFVTHLRVGTKESLSISPIELDPKVSKKTIFIYAGGNFGFLALACYTGVYNILNRPTYVFSGINVSLRSS